MTAEINKAWDHVLYRDGEKLLLSVLCGTVALYEVNIELNEAEREGYLQNGAEMITGLVQRIREDPEPYFPRRIQIELPKK